MSFDKLAQLKALSDTLQRQAEVLGVLVLAEKDALLVREAAQRLLSTIEAKNQLERSKP